MRKFILCAVVLTLTLQQTMAQYSMGDHWYDNPLGFEPVKLHTSMGFIIPAAVAGICLLATKNKSELTQRLSMYDEVGVSFGYKYPYAVAFQNSVGINYQLRRFLSAGAEFNIFLPRDEFSSPTGLAIRPFFRFYILNKSNWRLYFESGGGFIFFNTEFPQPTDRDNRLGTQINGFTKYGLGTEITVAPSWALTLGARHVHVSNGNTKGAERNPSHDSNGLFVGVARRFM